MKKSFLIITFIIINTWRFIFAQDLNTIYPELDKLYKHLHSFPEVSLQEEKTSGLIAGELRKIGFAVTENFGGYGVVGVLKNGNGKTILIRTDLDALPIEEKTSLSFKSKNNGVMHACGHDIHMTVFIGTAKILTAKKDKWKGTLIMIGQPAEEVGIGAGKMLDAGLYEKFGIPDYALALHINPFQQAGAVSYCPGYAMASSNKVIIKVKGIGGHGALPYTTIDPIPLTAQMILALQTIVSREINPIDPTVLTVGYIKGGTQFNIIPDEVEMGLTVRTFSDDVYKKIMTSIKNKITKIAESAGLSGSLLPEMTIVIEIPSLYNDPDLSCRAVSAMKEEMGDNNVLQWERLTASEDFSQFGRTKHKVPLFMFWLGTGTEEDLEKLKLGEKIPVLHSPCLITDYQNAIKTGIRSMTSITIDLLSGK